MNQQACDKYSEWMSLAQDGLLSHAQSRLLHAHLARCPICQDQWEAMTWVSCAFRAAPVVGPAPGFVARFEERLARYEEKKRRAMVGLLLGIGVIALGILALPSLLAILRLAGYLVLPYPIVAYLEGLWHWALIVLNSLADSAAVLARYLVAQPVGMAGAVGSAAVAAALCLLWTRLLVARMATQKTR